MIDCDLHYLLILHPKFSQLQAAIPQFRGEFLYARLRLSQRHFLMLKSNETYTDTHPMNVFMSSVHMQVPISAQPNQSVIGVRMCVLSYAFCASASCAINAFCNENKIILPCTLHSHTKNWVKFSQFTFAHLSSRKSLSTES